MTDALLRPTNMLTALALAGCRKRIWLGVLLCYRKFVLISRPCIFSYCSASLKAEAGLCCRSLMAKLVNRGGRGSYGLILLL